MPLMILGIVLGTLAEAVGFVLWRREVDHGDSISGMPWLLAGGLVGWALTAVLVIVSPASHPRRTGRIPFCLFVLFLLAAGKVLLWLIWGYLIPHVGLTVATLALIVGFHLKHAIAVRTVTGRSFQPTLWNPITVLSTLAASGGGAVWIAADAAGRPELAAVLWFVYAVVENLLQFLAGGLYEPPAHAQSPFSIVTEIRGRAVPALKQYLGPLGANLLGVRGRFSPYTRLHFCSFILIERGEQGDGTLVFEGNIDGPALSFLEDLATRDRDFLNAVYEGADGFPGPTTSPRAVADFLAENDYGAAALYVGQPGATREQIERDQALRVLVEAELDQNRAKYQKPTADACRAELQAFVRSQPGLAWVDQLVPTLWRVQFGMNVLYAALAGIVIGLIGYGWGLAAFDGPKALAVAVAVVVVGLIFVALSYVVWLRGREETDPQNRVVIPLSAIQKLQGHEDTQLQNHLVSITNVKAGWLRLLTLRAVLVAINLLARFVATRGDLSGIVTIHFARWVVLAPPGQTPRLLFLSNYDGSWENYLGEFVDRASNGLTAVWSNTQLAARQGFPHTDWLFLRGGSRDEQWFKNYARLSQRTDLLWFSAYPHLSMKHIANNREFRLGLSGELTDAARWLQRL
ncbi:hypothetical protein [Limnoglobus roseus]|uniref:Uncharacterized protein n=1 Tax=Limnoglobus roseus TaxID=2598579 RepID=A0A5C1A4M8_9BACT|nr:hypothetical protein [Limnoglobus roseus]QEL13357.1 hypothetical protein PX52LOC_00211 [Limnoglobus roseus]